MSASFNKLFEKGKAKIKEYQGSSHSQPQGQAYPSQQGQYPPQSGYGQQPPPNQYSPPNNNYGNPQYGPPPGQWGAQPPQHQQAFSPPPVPQHSKPHSSGPPPLPSRPSQGAPTPANVYWEPSFSPSTSVTANFRHELGAHGWGNNESQNYVDSPANSFHTPDGRLVVRAISQNGTYTSARLTSHQTLSRPRGYLTVTVLAPCAEGIWPAFWLLPQDPFKWPEDGEMDIFESWNGDCENHSCLHWGHYNGEDWNKHRVLETKIPDMPYQPHTFGFAWCEEEGVPGWRGRLMWYIDGRPVMRGDIPAGTRRLEDFRILINVAMGGNVCQGKLPKDGCYDFVVSGLRMEDEPAGGWEEFERAFGATPEGKTM